jgi:hypothetical protein
MMSYNFHYASVAGWIYGIVVLAVILCALAITQQLLFAFAAYNDAKSKNNKDATMWGLLVGFLGLIPGIIYLCVRNNSRGTWIVCPNCHTPFDGRLPVCPTCAAPNYYQQNFVNPYVEKQAKKAKNQLIAGIVLFAVDIVLVLVMVGVVMQMAAYYAYA